MIPQTEDVHLIHDIITGGNTKSKFDPKEKTKKSRLF